MTDITELMHLVEQRDAICERITADTDTVEKLRAEIAAACSHPTTVKRSQYFSGGYDHVSETHTWDECTICGKALNEKVERGGYQ